MVPVVLLLLIVSPVMELPRWGKQEIRDGVAAHQSPDPYQPTAPPPPRRSDAMNRSDSPPLRFSGRQRPISHQHAAEQQHFNKGASPETRDPLKKQIPVSEGGQGGCLLNISGSSFKSCTFEVQQH